MRLCAKITKKNKYLDLIYANRYEEPQKWEEKNVYFLV